MILLTPDDLAGSHGGVVSLLGQLYVLSGEADKEVGRSLNLAPKISNEARDKPKAVVSPEKAHFAVKPAEDLLGFARSRM